ncbi:rRNA N6-adenosine-methyltransferase METTL5-like [Watersipora subatra]|uniref:rRNA N6-adenosine-methyltransferase METTL5-like n=1 Tax=Watersipora subatra TaxID=2589382 RepID=UPI00355B5914
MPRLRLKQLENYLESVDDFDNPKILLEQYATRPHIAACVLHSIESQFGDIANKSICDVGCGSGRLSIGCSLLGASYVLGIDIDEDALDNCKDNIEGYEATCVDLLQMDALFIPDRLRKSFDVAIMNPPFGTKHNKGIDIRFLKAGLSLARTAVYSLHKTSTREHILKVCTDWGVKPRVLAQLRYDIPATYKHHKKKLVDIDVDFYRFEPAPTK